MHFLSTSAICVFVFFLIQTVSGLHFPGALRQQQGSTGCTISSQCDDAHEVCVNHECRKNVPCNKDEDCFFYAAADVANENPHPKCVRLLKDSPVPAGYGICAIYEKISLLRPVERLSGSNADHLDVNHIIVPGY